VSDPDLAGYVNAPYPAMANHRSRSKVEALDAALGKPVLALAATTEGSAQQTVSSSAVDI